MWRSIISMLALCSASPMAAQETQQNPAEGLHDIRLRGFAFSLLEGIERLELRHEEKTIGTLDLPTGQLRNRIMISSREICHAIVVWTPFPASCCG